MARPTKFTPEVARIICEAVEAGNYLVTAAALADVDADTVYLWVRQAQKPGASREKREFFGALTRARAKAETAAVRAIYADMKGGLLLEKTTVDDEGNRVTRKYTPPNGALALKFLRVAFPDRWADRRPIDAPAGEESGMGGGGSSIPALAMRLHQELHPDDIAEGVIVEDEGEWDR